jgi:hypothetical protein
VVAENAVQSLEGSLKRPPAPSRRVRGAEPVMELNRLRKNSRFPMQSAKNILPQGLKPALILQALRHD